MHNNAFSYGILKRKKIVTRPFTEANVESLRLIHLLWINFLGSYSVNFYFYDIMGTQISGITCMVNAS